MKDAGTCLAIRSAPPHRFLVTTRIMQINSFSTISRARLEQAGSASDDNTAPGSVKIRNPLDGQAPGARCLRRQALSMSVKQSRTQNAQKARAATKQPERSTVFPAAYQPR